MIDKIISKVLANKLKRILLDIISPSQSVFIPERLITDNVIVAYKMLHSIKISQYGKRGSMAIKLYISNAYDKVE